MDRARDRYAIRFPLRLAAAAGLAVDAYVHADLAARFDTAGSGISQGTLFVLEAALASLAAALILVSASRPAAAFGLLVALSALSAVLITRYADIGALGPLPNMYDPAWYPEKTLSAAAETLATLACAALLVTRRTHTRT
jgi:hypothetical protein